MNDDGNIAIMCGTCRKGDPYLLYEGRVNQSTIDDIFKGRPKQDLSKFESACVITNAYSCSNMLYPSSWLYFLYNDSLLSTHLGINKSANYSSLPFDMQLISNASLLKMAFNRTAYYRDNASLCYVTVPDRSVCSFTDDDVLISVMKLGKLAEFRNQPRLTKILTIIRG